MNAFVSPMRRNASCKESPSEILRNKLTEAIALEFDLEFHAELSEPITDRLKPIQVIVKACYPKYSTEYICHYTSSISLSLANLLNLDAIAIAQRLCKRLEAIAEKPTSPQPLSYKERDLKRLYFLASPSPLRRGRLGGRGSSNLRLDKNSTGKTDKNSLQFTTRVEGKGWLNFELSDRFLAECLLAMDKNICEDFLIPNLATEDSPPFVRSGWGRSKPANAATNSYIWELQYAYARCCALLRLAKREGLIDLQIPFAWQLLDANNRLLLNKSTEIQLAITHLAIADQFPRDCAALNEFISSPDCLKSCEALATAFLKFYDTCQIFGVLRGITGDSVGDRSSEIVQARLGLIQLTQRILTLLAPIQVTNCPAL
jgi:hypothetical protein